MSKLVKLTNTAAEAIRSANHDTLTPGRYSVPDTSDAIANLAVLTDRVDQLLGQLAANLQARHRLGGLTLDTFHGANADGEPTDELTTALGAIADAETGTGQTRRALRDTHNILAHIRDHSSNQR